MEPVIINSEETEQNTKIGRSGKMHSNPCPEQPYRKISYKCGKAHKNNNKRKKLEPNPFYSGQAVCLGKTGNNRKEDKRYCTHLKTIHKQ